MIQIYKLRFLIITLGFVALLLGLLFLLLGNSALAFSCVQYGGVVLVLGVIILQAIKQLKRESLMDHLREIAQRESYLLREIALPEFNEEETPVLRVFSNGTSDLIFEIFPPENGKLTDKQIKNLCDILRSITGVDVLHLDREHFVILSNSEDVIDKTVEFFRSL